MTIKTLQKTIVFLIGLFSLTYGYGQTEKDTMGFAANQQNTIIEKSVIKANFWPPGISYEGRISKVQSLSAEISLGVAAAIGYGYSSTRSASEFVSAIHVAPGLDLQYRYYYNSAQRKAKRKRTEMNSLNYIAGLLGVSFSKSDLSRERDLLTSKEIGVAWGFQRNYPKRFSLDFKLGVGYSITDEIIVNETAQYELINKRGFVPITNLTLGFWLNKKHK